ncbi:unnamed protein product [Paramecium primaurelia]|uniref:Uncharacterized protein n=1 Tax=Paramecium primaurelia TaxID=5886 RepID=A0A8S1M9B1_PARPR|nr:unnamed protein product [Paramecium primaurelia]
MDILSLYHKINQTDPHYKIFSKIFYFENQKAERFIQQISQNKQVQITTQEQRLQRKVIKLKKHKLSQKKTQRDILFNIMRLFKQNIELKFQSFQKKDQREQIIIQSLNLSQYALMATKMIIKNPELKQLKQILNFEPHLSLEIQRNLSYGIIQNFKLDQKQRKWFMKSQNIQIFDQDVFMKRIIQKTIQLSVKKYRTKQQMNSKNLIQYKSPLYIEQFPKILHISKIIILNILRVYNES